MIVAVASAKGGVGKTTSALHIAGALAGTGATLLVDDDPNASALRYQDRGARHGHTLPFEVIPGAQRHARQNAVDHLVIDTPARADPADVRALSLAADHLIIPATPDPMSLDAVLEATATLPAGRWRILLTMCPSRPERDAEEARTALEAAGLPVYRTQIRKAKAFIHAAMSGRLVWETTTYRAQIAGRDYHQLTTELLTQRPRGTSP